MFTFAAGDSTYFLNADFGRFIFYWCQLSLGEEYWLFLQRKCYMSTHEPKGVGGSSFCPTLSLYKLIASTLK